MITKPVPEIEIGESFNLLVINKTNVGYKSNNHTDMQLHPSDNSRVWLTGMSEMGLKLYFKNLIVKPISELQS